MSENVNDLELKLWKTYQEIRTDSLWHIRTRDGTAGSGKYHGNFIPEIPKQMMLRYTKRGDWVLDPFLGSGTTAFVAQELGRNFIGFELQETLVTEVLRTLQNTPNTYNTAFILQAINSELINNMDTKNTLLYRMKEERVKLLILHPPYHDIIKFSDNPGDLSNCKNVDDFLQRTVTVTQNCLNYMDDDAYIILVMSDIYQKGRCIPLAHLVADVLEKQCKLVNKATIVKNFGETAGKKNQENLWRYRALRDGLYVFKHEYIFVLKRQPTTFQKGK